MSEDTGMHFPRKAPNAFTWNFNTILTLVSFVGLLAAYWFGIRGDVDMLLDWKADTEIAAKERSADVQADFARLNTASNALDERLDQQEALSIRLSDRISAGEARSAEFAQTLRELQSSINQQSGDLKVILAWIDEQRRQQQRGER